MELKLKKKTEEKKTNKKILIERLWKIRREEKFSDWSDFKKELKL